MMVDVVIPTYKPNEKLLKMLDALCAQTVEVNKIVLMNTEQKYIENLFRGRKYEKNLKRVEVRNVSAWEFDHGKTRNDGSKGSVADFILYMTQDAAPYDDTLIEQLLKAFDDPLVASAYARQIPHDDATYAEQFSRSFNYPDQSIVKSAADIENMGIKAFFCSNACAMYRREIFEQLGKFPTKMIFNEDMVFAHKVLMQGYKIAYVADALVVHSHNYTNKQQFHRNFDLAVSQAMHPEVFEGVSSESEGKSYAKAALSYFKSIKKPYLFIPFGITCAYRLAGFKLGKRYNKMSHRKILKYTMSPMFFKKLWS